MVTSASGVQSANTISDFTLAGATPAQSADSFAQQLLTAIEGYLGTSGSQSQLQINIQSAGQNSAGSSQFVVTVEDTPASSASTAGTPAGSSSASASAAASPASTSAQPAKTQLDTSIFTSTAASAAIASGAAAPAAKAAASTSGSVASLQTPNAAAFPSGGNVLATAELAQMTPAEAYWAEQPPAVQALQNMPPEQRPAAAQALAAQGYSIDVPIMVWGQDPLATMLARETDGYTWVPSAMQADVGAAPGINYSATSNYDSKGAPPGSILVTTAFANGTNGQDAAAPGWEAQATS